MALKCECGSCRTCYQREYQRRYRVEHRERVKEWGRLSYEKNAAVICAKKAKERKENPEKFREIDARRKAYTTTRDPQKHRAHNSVDKAVKSGRLVPQPCERCGAEPVLSNGKRGVHAHHEDHTKRFDVQWLCFRCHRELHRKHVYPQEGPS